MSTPQDPVRAAPARAADPPRPARAQGGDAGVLDWHVEAASGLTPALSEELARLWSRDPWASPFAGAVFLGAKFDEARPCPGLLALGRRVGGSLAAAWPLLDRGGRLELVQGHRVDHAACLAAPDVDADEIGRGLAAAVSETGARGVFLDHLPAWGPTLPAARAALARLGWRARSFASNPNPVLALEPGPGLPERLRAEANRHRRLRVYANKLGRTPGFRFEALEGAEDLEGWARDFCDAHEWRWDATPTPSEYRFRAARESTLACLHAWQRDGTLVRFSIRLGEATLAMVAALRVQHRLVYHLVATSPAGAPHRAGQVLIREVLLWMAERGVPVLDFGSGDEAYKQRFGNRDEPVSRVFGTKSAWARDALRASVEESIRRSPRLQGLWDEWANRRIRGRLTHELRNLRIRLRVARATSLRELVPAGYERLRGGRTVLYRACGLGSACSALVPLGTFEALEFAEGRRGLLPFTRARVFSAAARGARAFALRGGCGVVWIAELPPGPRPPALQDLPGDRRSSLWCAWTALPVERELAGREAELLHAVRGRVPAQDWLIVAAPRRSEALGRALAAAGFEAFVTASLDPLLVLAAEMPRPNSAGAE